MNITYERVYSVLLTFLSDDLINFKKSRSSFPTKYAHLAEDLPERVIKNLREAITSDLPIDLLIKITQKEGCSKCHTVQDAVPAYQAQ